MVATAPNTWDAFNNWSFDGYAHAASIANHQPIAN